MAGKMATALLAGLLLVSTAHADSARRLLQTPATTVSLGSPATITVSAANPLVNAITITLARPYPQNGFYCNVTGDSRIPTQGVFPLTVRVPVGVTSTVVFANITGPIPGTSCTSGSSSVVQQGATVVQQQGGATSIVQQQQNAANSVVQQQGGSTVVQQQYATSVNQQKPNMPAMNCVANSSSVVQQQGPPSSVVQQSTPATVVQQQSTPSTVVQQQPATVVQQQAPATPKATSAPATVVQQQPATVVQQQTPATPKATSAPATVVQQQAPPVTVQQQSTPATVVQQQSQGPPSSVVQQTGRHLLQVGTIEYISNNGSTGQPQLSVLDTVEGVPNISFKPTAAGQTAQFNGGLQVAVTTTNDGFGTPYIPYRVDSRLSPQCGVQVNFVGI